MKKLKQMSCRMLKLVSVFLIFLLSIPLLVLGLAIHLSLFPFAAMVYYVATGKNMYNIVIKTDVDLPSLVFVPLLASGLCDDILNSIDEIMEN